MDARTLQRLGLFAVCAALASGCAPLRGTGLAPLTPKTPAEVVTAGAVGGGQVVSAGGQSPDPLSPPRQLPPVPAEPFGPATLPSVSPDTKFAYPPPADPHHRNWPTATGGRLVLAPHELSTQRIVELTLDLERLTKLNDALAARIRELEHAGAGRDQTLEEAARAVATVTAEAEKTRAALQAQVVRLQTKIKDLEEEDIALLREIIRVLGPPPPGGKP